MLHTSLDDDDGLWSDGANVDLGVCLFEDPNGRPRFLLTKRAFSLNSHSGTFLALLREVSLPGGKVEEGDAEAEVM
ncbi:hypothetical protein HU200_033281 [Digitaria exilis]|uniref:Nudix hydrolase domain-containing protein n=1 Tax=Digitaria exilis TaxID=1010633 RepID=A0A835BS52_9POAL|nr:hypothetical protein HU200_033281 [Digitaria exilis]